MTQDVIVYLTGMQFEMGAGGDSEPIETVSAGKYYEKDGKHYVFYDEPVEGERTVIKNRLTFYDRTLEVSKKGPINVHMVFEENKQNLTEYTTPFGRMMIGINTGKMTIDLSKEEEYLLTADYTLDANYEFLAECKIKIRICTAK